MVTDKTEFVGDRCSLPIFLTLELQPIMFDTPDYVCPTIYILGPCLEFSLSYIFQANHSGEHCRIGYGTISRARGKSDSLGELLQKKRTGVDFQLSQLLYNLLIQCNWVFAIWSGPLILIKSRICKIHKSGYGTVFNIT
jgi:hypothetical protein